MTACGGCKNNKKIRHGKSNVFSSYSFAQTIYYDKLYVFLFFLSNKFKNSRYVCQHATDIAYIRSIIT